MKETSGKCLLLKELTRLVIEFEEAWNNYFKHPMKGAAFNLQPDWDQLMKSLTGAEQRLLQFKRIHLIIGVRICTRCTQNNGVLTSKPISEFHTIRRKPHYWCKTCVLEDKRRRQNG